MSDDIGLKALVQTAIFENIDAKREHGGTLIVGIDRAASAILAILSERARITDNLRAQVEALTAERDAARRKLAEMTRAKGLVFEDTNPEADWIYHMQHACPACGGSGHKDDVTDAALAGAVRVKPLVWEKRWSGSLDEIPEWVGRDANGEIHGRVCLAGTGLRHHDELPASELSARQEDQECKYERRILSALEPQPAQADALEALVRKMVEAFHAGGDWERQAMGIVDFWHAQPVTVEPQPAQAVADDERTAEIRAHYLHGVKRSAHPGQAADDVRHLLGVIDRITPDAVVAEMREALANFLEMYLALANSGDAGYWDPETDREVIAARAALAKLDGKAPTS